MTTCDVLAHEDRVAVKYSKTIFFFWTIKILDKFRVALPTVIFDIFRTHKYCVASPNGYFRYFPYTQISIVHIRNVFLKRFFFYDFGVVETRRDRVGSINDTRVVFVATVVLDNNTRVSHIVLIHVSKRP